MHTAQDGDKKLAELWDKNMIPVGFLYFSILGNADRNAIRKFASDLVDDKFQDLRAVCDSALKELAALKAANTPDTQPEEHEPAETEDERDGREIYEEWCEAAKCEPHWKQNMEKHLWIDFAKRRPKVVLTAPKLREPGQVLCDALRDYLCPWRDRNDKHSLNAIAVALRIEAQP